LDIGPASFDSYAIMKSATKKTGTLFFESYANEVLISWFAKAKRK